MAHVTLPDGRELNVSDTETSLLDYYRGVGASVEPGEGPAAPSFPQTVEDGQPVEQLPPGESLDLSEVIEDPTFDDPTRTLAVEAPADDNEPAPKPKR